MKLHNKIPQPSVSRALPSAVLGVFLTVASVASAQTPSLRSILRSGDTLPNGDSVLGFADVQLAEDGRWASFVGVPDPGGSPLGLRALVVDGQVVAKQNDTLSTGETIRSLRDIAMGRDGELCLLFETEDTLSGATTDRVRLGNTTILSEGDLIVGAPASGGPGTGGPIVSLRSLDYQNDVLCIAGTFDNGPAGIREFQSLIQVTPGGLNVIVLNAEGDLPLAPGLPFAGFGSGIHLDTEPGGPIRTAVNVELEDASGTRHGILSGGFIFALDGTPLGSTGRTWALGVAGRTHINTFNERLYVGRTMGAGGNLRGTVVADDEILQLEGSGLNGMAAPIVDAFSSGSLRISLDGTALYSLPIVGGAELLMADEDILVRTGQSRVEGDLVTGLRARFNGQFFDATQDGRTVLYNMELDGGVQALVVIEREVGTQGTCSSNPNSTGVIGTLYAEGSRYLSANNLRITATSLPLNSFGYLLASLDTGSTANPGGSEGTLCLGGAIGRFVGQVQSSGSTGEFSTIVDLSAVPQPTGFVQAAIGETWHFQTWHRDSVMGTATSNFTQSLSVELR